VDTGCNIAGRESEPTSTRSFMARELDKLLNEGKQMTANGSAARAGATGAGAPSHPERMWLQADWHCIEEEVKRLQVRIAKATKECRWGKVKALQHLLTQVDPVPDKGAERWLEPDEWATLMSGS
jgi:hypothetical protein